MRWYRNLNFLYNMKKVTIVFDFESQSMDVSVNDARECVTPATTVEEMLANEVFAFRPVKTSHYVVLHYADIVWVEASNNNSVFHMEDLWQAGGNPDAARVGAALAVALMQGGGKPRPYRFSGKCLRGSKRKLYLCGNNSRQASQRCSNRGKGQGKGKKSPSF